MRIGIFADVHDHLDHLRQAVAYFNASECDLVVFAGDLVSTFAVPPLRKLRAPLVACYGDNEGNKVGLQAGFSILGPLGEPPFCIRTADGTRILLAHMERQFRGSWGEFDVAICAHTHKPRIARDDLGRLWINPGETSGWTFGRPSLAMLETSPLAANIVWLSPREISEQPAPPVSANLPSP